MSTSNEHPKADVSDRLAASDPRSVRGLIQRADQFAATGDARSASAFYHAAVRAAPSQGKVPPELAADLRRAQEMCAQYAAQYKSYLREQLAARGFDTVRSSARFAQSLDIILGEKRIFVQEPRYYYFPALPQIQFYANEQFPWLASVEAATDEIRAELLEVMQDPAAFSPYVTGHANRPRSDQQGMLNNPAWSAFYLWKNGEPVAGNAERCPRTLRRTARRAAGAWSRIDRRRSSSRCSSPARTYRRTTGWSTRGSSAICRSSSPGRAAFASATRRANWVEGRAWAFDDTIEHEAWNDSDRTRVILLFDVWRPELSDEERQLVVGSVRVDRRLQWDRNRTGKSERPVHATCGGDMT